MTALQTQDSARMLSFLAQNNNIKYVKLRDDYRGLQHYMYLMPYVYHRDVICFRYTVVNTLYKGGKYNSSNKRVRTDRTIPQNKPDIIIRDNEKGSCMLIDVAVSEDRNVIKKMPRRF